MDILEGSVDLARAVFLIGAVLALLYKKKLGITPGGVIVPGTLAGILLDSVSSFIVIYVLAIICHFVYQFTFKRYALSRKASTFIILAISLALGLVTVATTERFKLLDQDFLLLSLITPGLIAISARKYGFLQVTFGSMVITLLTCAVGLGLSYVIPHESLTYLSTQLAQYKPLELTKAYIVLPISLIVSAAIYYRFGMRGGGYLITPFFAIVLTSCPLQAGLLLAGIGVSYGIMWLIQRYTLIFGLERFVACLFMGYFVTTAIDLLAVHVGLGAGYRPAPLVLIVFVAVVTNDLCLQSANAALRKGIVPALLVSYLTRIAV